MYYGATCRGAQQCSNVFDLGSIPCSIRDSVFDVVCVREYVVGEMVDEMGVVRAEAMFLAVVCCMQATMHS